MEKPTDVTILTINTVFRCNRNTSNYDEYTFVTGLGSDMKVYYWGIHAKTWFLFRAK